MGGHTASSAVKMVRRLLVAALFALLALTVNAQLELAYKLCPDMQDKGRVLSPSQASVLIDKCLETKRKQVETECPEMKTDFAAIERQTSLIQRLEQTIAFMSICRDVMLAARATPVRPLPPRPPVRPEDCQFPAGRAGLPLGPISALFQKYFSTNYRFHQGNLREHSAWTAFAMQSLLETPHVYATSKYPLYAEKLQQKKKLLVAIAYLHDLGKAGNPWERSFTNILHHFHYGYEMVTGQAFPQHCFLSEDDDVPAHKGGHRKRDPSVWLLEDEEVKECNLRYGQDLCPVQPDDKSKGYLFEFRTYCKNVLFPALGIPESEYEETLKLIAILVGIHTGYGKAIQNTFRTEDKIRWLANLDCLVQTLNYNGGVLDVETIYMAVLLNAADVRGSSWMRPGAPLEGLPLPPSCNPPSYPTNHQYGDKLAAWHREYLELYNPVAWLMEYVSFMNGKKKEITASAALQRGLDRNFLRAHGWVVMEQRCRATEESPFRLMARLLTDYFYRDARIHNADLLEESVWTAQQVEQIVKNNPLASEVLSEHASDKDRAKLEFTLVAAGFLLNVGKAGNFDRRFIDHDDHEVPHEANGFEYISERRFPICPPNVEPDAFCYHSHRTLYGERPFRMRLGDRESRFCAELRLPLDRDSCRGRFQLKQYLKWVVSTMTFADGTPMFRETEVSDVVRLWAVLIGAQDGISSSLSGPADSLLTWGRSVQVLMQKIGLDSRALAGILQRAAVLHVASKRALLNGDSPAPSDSVMNLLGLPLSCKRPEAFFDPLYKPRKSFPPLRVNFHNLAAKLLGTEIANEDLFIKPVPKVEPIRPLVVPVTVADDIGTESAVAPAAEQPSRLDTAFGTEFGTEETATSESDPEKLSLSSGKPLSIAETIAQMKAREREQLAMDKIKSDDEELSKALEKLKLEDATSGKDTKPMLDISLPTSVSLENAATTSGAEGTEVAKPVDPFDAVQQPSVVHVTPSSDQQLLFGDNTDMADAAPYDSVKTGKQTSEDVGLAETALPRMEHTGSQSGTFSDISRSESQLGGTESSSRGSDVVYYHPDPSSDPSKDPIYREITDSRLGSTQATERSASAVSHHDPRSEPTEDPLDEELLGSEDSYVLVRSESTPNLLSTQNLGQKRSLSEGNLAGK